MCTRGTHCCKYKSDSFTVRDASLPSLSSIENREDAVPQHTFRVHTLYQTKTTEVSACHRHLAPEVGKKANMEFKPIWQARFTFSDS